MKTRELIKQLQDADPSGDLEVVVSNHPVLSVEKLPAYYDGEMQVLSSDKQEVTFVGDGCKVRIYLWDLECAILDNPDLKVSGAEDYMQIRIENWKRESRQLNKELQEEFKDLREASAKSFLTFEKDLLDSSVKEDESCGNQASQTLDGV